MTRYLVFVNGGHGWESGGMWNQKEALDRAVRDGPHVEFRVLKIDILEGGEVVVGLVASSPSRGGFERRDQIDGLTLRDQFAMALATVAQGQLGPSHPSPDGLARRAYLLADAMIKARRG